MNVKKLLGFMAILLAVVAAAGGYVAFQNKRQNDEKKAQIEEAIETKVSDIVVEEGGTLPPPQQVFAELDDSLIKKETISADISKVDSTVPGTYEAVYTFDDVMNETHERIVPITVQADLLSHVTGMTDIQIEQGEELPENTAQGDELVFEVTRDDTMVDENEAGTYPVTYNVIGKDGNMESATYQATVLAKKPDPTPTATPTPAPEKTEKEEQQRMEEIEETHTGNLSEEERTESLLVKEHTVETGDNSPILLLVSILAAAAAVVLFIVARKIKK